MIDVSETTMSHLETGEKSPTISECESLANALEISLSDLLLHPAVSISIHESPQSVGYIHGNQNVQSRDNEILKFFSAELEKRDIQMQEFMMKVLEKVSKVA
jgi:transcriptional regulator with XRE-family HTH domain